jgi:hypothetical protein
MSLWDSISAKAKKAGDTAATQAKRGKLNADILLLDREVLGRKKAFGVTMYDHVSPLSQSADFYAASDDLTNLLRPPLITAQKEIQALAAKRVKLMESLAQAEANRAAAFPTKAETVGQKFVNFGKAGVLHGGETKIKAELAIVDRKIKGFKQSFGVELFDSLAEAEDQRGYLPSDRQVRNMYDACRGEVQRIEDKRKAKIEEIVALGGKAPARGSKSTQDPTEPALNISQSASASATSQTFQSPSESFAPAVGFTSNPPSGGTASSGYSSPSFTPSSTNVNSDNKNNSNSQGDDLILFL